MSFPIFSPIPSMTRAYWTAWKSVRKRILMWFLLLEAEVFWTVPRPLPQGRSMREILGIWLLIRSKPRKHFRLWILLPLLRQAVSMMQGAWFPEPKPMKRRAIVIPFCTLRFPSWILFIPLAYPRSRLRQAVRMPWITLWSSISVKIPPF